MGRAWCRGHHARVFLAQKDDILGALYYFKDSLNQSF